MHGFGYSIPLFVTRVQGMRIVVTPDIVSDVLRVLRVNTRVSHIAKRQARLGGFVDSPSPSPEASNNDDDSDDDDDDEDEFILCLKALYLFLVNTRVSHIAKRQARLGGFVDSPSPSPEASNNDDDSDDDDDDEDEDAS
nr:WASH complex subunit 3-like [Quercus suber]